MAVRDMIIEPFSGLFGELSFPHKVRKGFVRVYAMNFDKEAAQRFLEQHGYTFDGEKDAAFRYHRMYGKYWVGAIYNANDRTLMIAAQRERK